jgi:hypothetical protein
VLRVRCSNIIVFNARAPNEKSDDSKDCFYEELEQVFDHFFDTFLVSNGWKQGDALSFFNFA